MLKSTVGQLLVNEILPPEYRDYNRVIGSDEMEQVLAGIAKSHPEQYRDISAKLMRLGNRGSVDGGVTLRLSDTLPTFDRSVIYKMMDAQEDKIRKDRSLSDAEKRTLIDDMYTRMTSLMFDNAYDTALKNKNPFALQVKSKARGNKAQLGAMIASPGVYTDTKGNPVPMFIRHSYADGLSPAEMWAGSYGARNGVVGGKLMTRKGGELGKLMASLAIDQVVTESDCGSPYGLPVSATDKDNIGCVLAYDAGGHKAGEVINKATIQDFVKHNVKDIAVRSPVTCQAKHGVCAHCCGVRESGKFPELGYNLGVTAASALSERIAQAALGTKHSGRLTKGTGQYQGFDMIKALTTVPKSYPDKASVAPKDGTVDKIEKAPQGGEYITVGGERTYVPPGYDVLVKQGDEVEAGDQLSDGVIDPKDVVKYKGVGEGRRYFTNRFTQALRDSSYKANRRNVEAIARALVDHVQIEDEDSEGQMLPGDVTTYTNWAFGYKPRPDSVIGSAKSLIGKYLEQPALHYTIGTRITKNVAKELDKFGRGQNIIANANPVNVTPVMQSIVKSTGTDKDWMTRLGTTYLKSRLLEDAQHGSTSDIHSTSPIPGLAKGVEFGNYFNVGVKRPGGYTY
jgi:DNA-directed RNA polymerase subunit beta'